MNFMDYIHWQYYKSKTIRHIKACSYKKQIHLLKANVRRDHSAKLSVITNTTTVVFRK